MAFRMSICPLYTHIYMPIYTHVYTPVYTHVCVHVYVHVHVNISCHAVTYRAVRALHASMRMHACISACVHVLCAHMCMSV